ncbi:hypothetical protein [Massilia sp. METH4]|uniref:hypothetical protein n=1 Tax=Massilia sp. METH4 TaxID=3123041 RepID=UPI0030D0412F
MPIIKEIEAPSGTPIAYHKVISIRIECEAGYAYLLVRSYVSETAYRNHRPIAWQWENIPVPLESLAGVDLTSLPAVESALVVLEQFMLAEGEAVALPIEPPSEDA